MSVPLAIRIKFLEEISIPSFVVHPTSADMEAREVYWRANACSDYGDYLESLVRFSRGLESKDEANQQLNQLIQREERERVISVRIQPPPRVGNPALVFAATAGCRVLLERFAWEFQDAHRLRKQKACTYDLTNASTAEILNHSQTCTGIIKELMEAKITWEDTPEPTGTANASTLFASLSDALHRNMFQGPGNVMWVYDGLERIEKQWMLRYLKKKKYHVRIIEQSGLDREPRNDEIYTPPTTPPKKEKKRKNREEENPEVEVVKKVKKKKNKEEYNRQVVFDQRL